MTLPNLPNCLTISRIFLVPLLVVVLLTRTERWELIGGIIFAVAKQLGIPIRFIGVGEAIEDLRPFDAADFVDALFESR